MIKQSALHLLLIANFISFGLPLKEEGEVKNLPARQSGNFAIRQNVARKKGLLKISTSDLASIDMRHLV